MLRYIGELVLYLLMKFVKTADEAYFLICNCPGIFYMRGRFVNQRLIDSVN